MEESDARQTTPASAPRISSVVTLLGVDYWHIRTSDGGDLHATRHGLACLEHLMPENWFEREWFKNNSERLEGSSTVYRVATKTVNGRNANLVVKWCRVGEHVPFDTLTLNKFAQAEFNSPYEEFSLVMEMRETRKSGIIRTHKPLGIYVPAERLQLWQTGRSESKMAQKKAKHRDVELDIYRQYILIYEWIKGASAVEVLQQTDISPATQSEVLAKLTSRANEELAVKGFRVIDMKPAHIIIRLTPERKLLRYHSGGIAYALVDFELLERTPEHEQEVVQARRHDYLLKQRDRFVPSTTGAFPEHLKQTQVLGVDYVHGHTESTQGALWVAGKVPGLFDYFLPERWRRTPKVVLSKTNEVYYTKTKDNINVVWKVSRVGEIPDVEETHPNRDRILAHGYNSPFEEFKLALDLGSNGILTVYPRAIYMSGLESESPVYAADTSRYKSHKQLLTPAGGPILSPNHIYITVWGFWNGRDELLADEDRPRCEGVNLDLACQSGYISKADHKELLETHKQRLAAAGMEDLNLNGDHLLLSIDPSGRLIRDEAGAPETRVCNFELLMRLGA
jgi:hypothetical protein